MSLVLALVAAASAQDFGYVAIMQQARSALVAGDYKTAKTLLTAAEAAAPTSSSPLAEQDIANLPFYRGLIEWRAGDKDNAALNWWRKVLVIAPQFEPDKELLPEVDGQDVLYALRGEVRNYDQFATGIPDDMGDTLIFIDGKRLTIDDMLSAGRHLVQLRCADGNFVGSWYDYGQAPADYAVLCTGGTYLSATTGKPPKVDKKAEKAAAAAAAKAAKEAEAKAKADAKAAAEAQAKADKEAAEKAAADKAAADKLAAEKAAADKAAADKATADKATADKAAADKAAADKATADKAAADKATADKATADKATADKASADKASADKASADKAAADKATADKAAADKAAADKAAADKATADKAAADKAAADKIAADKVAASKATAEKDKGGVDIPAVLMMVGGGGLLAGAAGMNFVVVEPAYTAMFEANENPGTMSQNTADAWQARYDFGRYGTLALAGGGLALLGAGVVVQLVEDSPVVILPNGFAVTGRW